ncbi:UNKNOWN [Stylonychia lemnae]|uniref:Uncharacterized protein n=1 Tax=Stylonychia lemnae TaxID=5949 RepID=A0A078AJK4_STYLE|nr:UNKNOWN [Stylonychia lemnae]|eukprot:CDW82545.1 UNKNOWN [Stylonychia lemnae]
MLFAVKENRFVAENKEKEEEWPEYIAQNFEQQEKDKGKLPENNQTIKEHSSNAGDDKQKEFGPKDQSNQELKEFNLPEINKKKGILQPPLDSIEEIVQPQNEDSMLKEEQRQLQSKEDKKQTDHKSEEENEKSGPKSSSKENGFLNMNKKLHDSQPIIEEDMNEDGEYYDEDGQDQIAKVIDKRALSRHHEYLRYLHFSY